MKLRTLAWLLVLLLVSLATSGCQNGKLDSSEQQEPAATPPSLAMTKQRARLLDGTEMGSRLCLERSVPDGTGGQTSKRIPVVSVIEDAHWNTEQLIPSQQISHVSNCAARQLGLNGQSIAISGSASNGFKVDIGTVFSRTLQAVSAGTNRVGSSHLYATASCKLDELGCPDLDGMDLYLYLVDVRTGKDNEVEKFVMLDFFDPDDASSGCQEERPGPLTLVDHSANEDCPVPAEIDELELLTLSSGNVVGVQTGIGGGYEPPF